VNRKKLIILSLITLSELSTIYAIFMLLSFHYTSTVSGVPGNPTMGPVIALKQPYFLIPISIGIAGWLTTVFEVITLKESDLKGPLRKKMSEKGFDRSVYRLFSGRGGIRRLAIIKTLETPRLRNEIANITLTDWKEVDRNLKILESANMVQVEYAHASLSVYQLTEEGRDLLSIISSLSHDKHYSTNAARS